MAWRMSTGFKNRVLASDGFSEILKNGQIRVFTGPQPSSADAAETGQLLCVVTNGSGAMVSGVATNGINLDIPSDGQVERAVGEVWSGKNLATGVAGWFRWYPNDFDTQVGAASSLGQKVRLDGNCGTANAQMILPSTSLKENNTTTLDTVLIKI